MRLPLCNLLIIFTLLSCLAATNVSAEPIDYSEVSLLVRARESESSIIQEVSTRKLARQLTPQQEGVLRSQGARDSLLQALRAPGVLLSAVDASAFEARRESRKAPRATDMVATAANSDDANATEGLHVFDVAPGHPVNLSQWGGPDYDFAFHAPTRLDEGGDDAVMIDNVRTGTHVATYLGAGRAEDNTTSFDRRNYVSVLDHSFARGLRIDRTHPVSVKGSPYTLYPVYAAGGVSLYYIGGSSHSVKLAVSTTTR